MPDNVTPFEFLESLRQLIAEHLASVGYNMEPDLSMTPEGFISFRAVKEYLDDNPPPKPPAKLQTSNGFSPLDASEEEIQAYLVGMEELLK